MGETSTTGCRLGACFTRLSAATKHGEILKIDSDSGSTEGRHGVCQVCPESVGASRDPRRLLQPQKRGSRGWEVISWEQALDEIASRLKAIRRARGAESLGIYTGIPAMVSTRTLVRSVATGVAWGTPHVFGPLSHGGAPWLRAAELVLGHPVALQGDLGRAHHVVLLGANQEAQGWGPLQGGRSHAADLAFSRKTKGTKVVTVDPRRTPEAARADVHLSILPGTELFFVLGLIRSVLDQGWSDAQYLRDYCTPIEPLEAALAPWTLERCAEACGLSAGEIQAVALKFSRAAMAVTHRSPQALGNEHGTLTAWAILVLHAVTANLMRPGGLYHPAPILDPQTVLSAIPTEDAPRLGELPLIGMFAPGALLTERIRSAALGALLVVQGDPARENPGGASLKQALESLDLLVVLDVAHHETSRLAHYVLPATHPWERTELNLHLGALLPSRGLYADPALVPPPGEARDPEQVLRELFRKVGAGFGRGAHGVGTRALAAAAASMDLASLEDLALSHAGTSREELMTASHGWGVADMDRSTWKVSHADGRVQLLPPVIAAALAALEVPSPPPGFPLRLLGSAARDSAFCSFDRPKLDPGVTVHPSLGFAEGQELRVVTPDGWVTARAHLDPTLRPEAVDLPLGYAADVMALLSPSRLDPLCGTPALNGAWCRVEA